MRTRPQYDEDMEFFLRAAMAGGVTPTLRPTLLRRIIAFILRRQPTNAPKTWTYVPPVNEDGEPIDPGPPYTFEDRS